MRQTFHYLLLSLLLPVVAGMIASCEKVDISEDENSTKVSTGVTNQISPTSLGHGTQESPFSPEHIRLGQAPSNAPCWVVGYVVGSTYRSMSNANFTAETTYSANVLISSYAMCDTTALCIPVEITSNAVRKVLSLADNPDRHRQCAMILATPDTYLNQQGLRKVASAYWLPDDFSIRDLDSTPEQWKEEVFEQP